MDTEKRVLHLVANAHLDPIWQWAWEEGAVEALSTFGTAVKLLQEFPEFIFVHNESLLYEWIEEYEPELFNKIKELVSAGRWVIVGGWYVQPDCNIPGGESFVRQILFGHEYFKNKFGVETVTGYNLDPFGHNGGLPQILKKSGYKYYIHCRPVPAEREMSSDLYVFRGVDGSEILGCRTSLGWYNTARGKAIDKVKEGIALANTRGEDLVCFWGLGDHGGGASKEDLTILKDILGEVDGCEVYHSDPESYFNMVASRRDRNSLPVIEPDFQRTFTGCYTSASHIKRGHRKAEGFIAQAERFASLASVYAGLSYPKDELDAAWKDHLFNEFHDILAGSSSKEGTQDGVEIYGHINTIARRVRHRAALALAKTDPPITNGIPVYVFNPHSFAYNGTIEADFMIDYHPTWDVKVPVEVVDSGGLTIPSQEETPTSRLPFNWRKKVVFNAEVPPMSHVRYMICNLDEPAVYESMDIVDEDGSITINTGSIVAKFDKSTGLMSGLTDLNTDDDLLSGAAFVPLAIDDKGDCWGMGIESYRDVVGEFHAASPDVVARVAGYYEADSSACGLRIIENGPVRAILESVLEFGASNIIQRFYFYPNESYFTLQMTVNWYEPHRMLKLSIPTALKDPKVTCEVPYGAIERAADGTEHVGQRWAFLSSEGYGIGVINTGQYGFDSKEGDLRLSILRSPVFCHGMGLELEHDMAHRFMDFGEHEITLGFTFGAADSALADTVKYANQLNIPVLPLAYFPKGPMDLPRTSAPAEPKSFLSVMPETVVLTALKQAEDENGMILRLHESAGKSTDASVVLMNGQMLSLQFNPFELKSFRLIQDGNDFEIEECDLMERKIED